ncbi:MAG TPA: LytTR family DNA-binding domain-containing protein [Allosphingosinicella sp.]
MTAAVASGAVPSELRTAARLAALAALFAAFLATTGALDTEAAPQLPRLAYWLFIALVSAGALELAHRRFDRPGADPAARWRLRALGLAALVLPLTLLSVLTCKLLFGGRPSTGGFLLLLPGMTSILAALQLVLALFMPAPAEPAAVAAPPAADGAALRLLLPLPLRAARIEALEAEDHYVRVHTDAGAALLRMRLRDAVDALGEAGGLRPHRSWWVAADAVAALGRTSLTLACGAEVPNSRRARPALGPSFRGTSAAR